MRWLLLGLLVVGWAVASQPPAGRWVRVGESAHFRYYELADYQNTPRALSRAQVSIALLRLEVFWELVAPQWNYPPEAKIAYYRFASADDLARLTGRRFNDRALSGQGIVLSIHASDPYELAQVLTEQTSPHRIADFWLEGIARYYAWPWMYCPEDNCACAYQARLGGWNQRSVHYWAQADLRKGVLPRLEELVYTNLLFERLPTATAYPAAGSFVAFLLEVLPAQLPQFRQFLTLAASARSQAELLAAFQQVFGLSLSTAEVRWHRFLEGWNEGDLR
ncbi:hypothetical protein [Meiothermus hypogaeus]|uniref:Uncharacterized protein n=2 Tax=Meiothermus hypogaeus TaxID=884155 RepID=A0A511QXD9_9DEIN|nr:hypothetical protein [Meiothermus hypogaeus]RIH77489.1 hypothetical protein Mhypo_01988 [Meiothermus hypogaeus]GEM82041.1 hypothetical protein MHY01S_02070 [Meiothermus hypogaeus NBRC 106114]